MPVTAAATSAELAGSTVPAASRVGRGAAAGCTTRPDAVTAPPELETSSTKTRVASPAVRTCTKSPTCTASVSSPVTTRDRPSLEWTRAVTPVPEADSVAMLIESIVPWSPGQGSPSAGESRWNDDDGLLGDRLVTAA
ncbi:hypothetical protein GCM10009740_23450 [Terrabacter terrae]|uniref:Uncharacterized protein n=1 Tax=Terrabacter terrae TaxID=318434 RepID=A0ABN3B9Y3_9MICO